MINLKSLNKSILKRWIHKNVFNVKKGSLATVQKVCKSPNVKHKTYDIKQKTETGGMRMSEPEKKHDAMSNTFPKFVS